MSDDALQEIVRSEIDDIPIDDMEVKVRTLEKKTLTGQDLFDALEGIADYIEKYVQKELEPIRKQLDALRRA